MAHAGGPTAQANAAAGPRTPLQHEQRQEQKRDLASWWKNFKRSDKKPQEPQAPQGIFGVPLQDSIRYANVAISLINDEGHSYIYGYVPIVVAKCGVFLKEKATETEGIFRLAGSEKRIKELKVAFDSPDRFGKGLDWTGYTVHDAANILRRYFNQLPEPIIPLDFYNRFRDPLRNHQAQAVGAIEAQSPSVGEFNPDAAIHAYQQLITELPPLNRQLLLYILDLLAVFASKADQNKMTTANLAAIFQPGILSHPQHDMAPPEYRLSQDVLIFLIENQDSFLIGMQGTAADPETVRDVQSGTPNKTPGTPPTPGRSRTIIGRSSSNASGRPESTRKVSEIRRAGSVSSKQSKVSDNGPAGVAVGMSPSGSVHRSNTVPSRHDGSNARSPRLNKVSSPSTPRAASPAITEEASKPWNESIQSTPIGASVPQFPSTQQAIPIAPAVVAAAGSEMASTNTQAYQTPKRDTAPLLTPPTRGAEGCTERPAQLTPSTSPGRFLDIFKQSPSGGDDMRKPNKLQKRRLPGTSLSSAHSSTHSLTEGEPEGLQKSAVSPTAVAATSPVSPTDAQAEKPSTPAERPADEPTISNTSGFLAAPSRNLSVDNSLRPSLSPSHSYHSAVESDTDMVGDDMPKDQAPGAEKEKRRHRFRFSRSQNKFESSPAPAPNNTLTATTGKESATSRSTVDSGSAPRKSFQESTPLTTSAADPAAAGHLQGQQTFSSTSTEPVFSDSEREKKGGGLGSWIRGKMGGNKDRARTPERNEQRRSRQDLADASFSSAGGSGLPLRGASAEAPALRAASEESAKGAAPVATAAAPTITTTADDAPDADVAGAESVPTTAPADAAVAEASPPAAEVSAHAAPASPPDTAAIPAATTTAAVDEGSVAPEASHDLPTTAQEHVAEQSVPQA